MKILEWNGTSVVGWCRKLISGCRATFFPLYFFNLSFSYLTFVECPENKLLPVFTCVKAALNSLLLFSYTLCDYMAAITFTPLFLLISRRGRWRQRHIYHLLLFMILDGVKVMAPHASSVSVMPLFMMWVLVCQESSFLFTHKVKVFTPWSHSNTAKPLRMCPELRLTQTDHYSGLCFPLRVFLLNLVD